MHKMEIQFKYLNSTDRSDMVYFRDVPVNHPVLGICRVSHYPILTGPGKIINPSKKNQSKTLNRIGDKNVLCGIYDIQSYKLVFCVQYFLINNIYSFSFI